MTHTKRITDSQDQVPYLKIIGIPQFQEGQGLFTPINAEDGKVRTLVPTFDNGIELPPVRKDNGNLVGTLDNMIIGDD